MEQMTTNIFFFHFSRQQIIFYDRHPRRKPQGMSLFISSGSMRANMSPRPSLPDLCVPPVYVPVYKVTSYSLLIFPFNYSAHSIAFSLCSLVYTSMCSPRLYFQNPVWSARHPVELLGKCIVGPFPECQSPTASATISLAFPFLQQVTNAYILP